MLYGSESGNSEELADRTAKEARRRGFKVVLKSMADVAPGNLVEAENLLVIVSTWGDGEPPESAESFYHSLMEEEHAFGGVNFSVCALGDTSYEKFCQTGKDVDERLEALGAKRLAARKDCDVDYEDAWTEWVMDVLGAVDPGSVMVSAAEMADAGQEVFGKKNPFPANLLNCQPINGQLSKKETIHVEYSLDGSGLVYQPGDALGVVARNAPDVIGAVLSAARLRGDETIETKVSGRKLLADALRDDFDITALSRNVLGKLQIATGSSELEKLLADDAKEKFHDYVFGREIVDAIEDFAPNGLSADVLAGLFRKLPPRLYSIASSPLAHPGEVHLTVAVVRYETHGRKRKGVCSSYMADLVKPGEDSKVFVVPNKNFHLPEDPGAPIIMVGPGTGIAPFRSFIEHRAEMGHPGKNWLIMGDQYFQQDFLYQLEWQEYLKSGVLTKLDTAFSRDQPEKVYVQHRMLQNGKKLFEWLEQGAYFYVCGDALRMASDVHDALISVIRENGGMSREEAETYVEGLKAAKRYKRDVY